MKIRGVLFDLDGTLVDSNGYHVAAWREAFGEAGHDVPEREIAGQIGKGGDLLVPALLPDLAEEEAERLADRHGEIFAERYLARVRPFPQAGALVRRVRDGGGKVALASSAGRSDLDHYAGLLDIENVLDAMVSADDVETSKPAGDIFAAALDKLGLEATAVVALGDTPYDVEAAGKCGIATVGLRSGGFDDAALEEAGAIALYDDVAQLLADYDRSPLGR